MDVDSLSDSLYRVNSSGFHKNCIFFLFFLNNFLNTYSTGLLYLSAQLLGMDFAKVYCKKYQAPQWVVIHVSSKLGATLVFCYILIF